MSDNPTRKISAMKITFVALVLIAGTAILCAMVKIQWVNGKMWRAKAEEREHDIRTIPARRGNIHSSDGNILASTVPVCDLYLDLGRWEKRGKDNKVVRESMVTDSTFTKKHFGEVCTLLHEATPSKSAAYYHNLIITEWRSESPRRCFAVARNIPYSYWAKICQVPGWKRVVVRTKDGESVVRRQRHRLLQRRQHTNLHRSGGLLRLPAAWTGRQDILSPTHSRHMAPRREVVAFRHVG